MNETRKTLTIYFGIWCVSVLLALGSTLWLGIDARVPVDIAADGVVTKSRSIILLWFMPGIASVLYGTLALGAWFEAHRRRTRPPVELSEDARRGLATYGRTVRNGMIGFGLLIWTLQIFMLLRSAGVAAPLGLDREGLVRLFNVIAGALFAYMGNVTPKLPWVRGPGLDTSPFYRANRLVGWTFMLGGVGYALSALIPSMERMTQVNGCLIAGMLGVSVAAYLSASIAAWRRNRGAAVR